MVAPVTSGGEPEANAIFDRIKDMNSLESDAELAEFLGYTSGSLWYYRTNGKIPYDRIVKTMWHEDLNYIFKGAQSLAQELSVRLNVQAPEGVDVSVESE